MTSKKSSTKFAPDCLLCGGIALSLGDTIKPQHKSLGKNRLCGFCVVLKKKHTFDFKVLVKRKKL